jgi:thymidylate kinase
MRDEELILRFLALYFNGNNYHKPMKEFLNQFMGKNQGLNLHLQPQLRQSFEQTIEVIHQSLGNQAFKPKKMINAAVFDAVMIGIARRLEKGKIDNSERLKEIYQKLLNEEKFLRVTVDTARTTEKDAVNSRIEIATQAFAAL